MIAETAAAARSRCTIIFSLTSLLFLAACGTSTVKFDIDTALDRTPAIRPLPVSIGVYYPPEFRTYKRVDEVLWVSFEYPVGEESVALFEQVLAGMFQEVVALKAWPLENTENVAYSRVLIPEVEHFSLQTPPDVSKLGPFAAMITYRISLYVPTGRKVASWSVAGASQYSLSRRLDLDIRKKEQLAVRDSIRKAVANLVVHFGEQPAVKSWLSEQGIVTDVSGQPMESK